jgi:hypothetical protein
MSYPTIQELSEQNNKASEAEERRNRVIVNTASRRLLLLVKQENSRGGVPSVFRDNFLMTTEELLDKMSVRMSVKKLYGRYRGIYLHALADALAIVMAENTKDGAKNAIIDRLVELGTIEKEAKQATKE